MLFHSLCIIKYLVIVTSQGANGLHEEVKISRAPRNLIKAASIFKHFKNENVLLFCVVPSPCGYDKAFDHVTGVLFSICKVVLTM